jgi:hypothetical protein
MAGGAYVLRYFTKIVLNFLIVFFYNFLCLFAFNSTSAAVTVRTAIQRLRKTAKTIVE